MPTIDNKQRLLVLVKNAPCATLHLIAGSGETGIVFFACEQAPLMTFQSYGLPSRCPICGSRASSWRFCRGCALGRETQKRAQTECIDAPAVCGGIAKPLKSRAVYSMDLETEESCPAPDW